MVRYLFPMVSAFVFSAAAYAESGRMGFAELIGRAESFRLSEPIQTPWDTKDKGGYGKKLRGYARRTNFTLQITANRDTTIHTLALKEAVREPYPIKAGQKYHIYNRPVTTWSGFQCSFSVSEMKVDWGAQPVIRVIAAAEGNYSSLKPEKKGHPVALIAYLIQVKPEGEDADLPPEHWPVWYLNNWIHFSRDVLPTMHYRYLSNHGFIFWSWGVFDPPANLKGKPAVGVYRIVWHPRTREVSSVVLHTPGACELIDALDERLRYSRAPGAKIKASRISGKAPLKVRFRGSARDPDGDKIIWYFWDFDGADGVQFHAAGKRASHVYAKPGTYVVSLTAMDTTGQPGRAHVRVQVLAGDRPVAGTGD